MKAFCLLLILGSFTVSESAETTFTYIKGGKVDYDSCKNGTMVQYSRSGLDTLAERIQQEGVKEIWLGARRVPNPNKDNPDLDDLWQFPDGEPARHLPVREKFKDLTKNCLTLNIKYKGMVELIPANCKRILPVACTPDPPNVLVAVAGYNSGYYDDVDIAYLDGDTSTCTTIPDYPFYADGVSAFFMNEVLYACGGYNDDTSYYENRCYFFDPKISTSMWQEVPQRMITRRGYFPVASVEGGSATLLIGGYSEISSLDSVEIFDGTSHKHVMNLTSYRDAPCGFALNEEEFFVGGGDEDELGQVYNWKTKSHVRDIDLIYSHGYLPACGLITKSNGDQEIILMTDGYAEAISMSTWTSVDISRASTPDIDTQLATQFGNTFLLAGGYYPNFASDRIFEFVPDTYEWINRTETLGSTLGYRGLTTVTPQFLGCQ